MVQVQESEELCRYACSPRVVPLMTTRMHARRTARLVQQPMVAAVADRLLNFSSSCQAYLQPCPSLQVRLHEPDLQIQASLGRLDCKCCQHLMHARRTARLVQQPMVAAVADRLLNFPSSCQAYLQPCRTA